MTNYEKYQLRFMIDNELPISYLINVMQSIYKSHAGSPEEIFEHFEQNVGFNGIFWASEKDFEKLGLCITDTTPNLKDESTKYYKYPLQFTAWLPVTNLQLGKSDIKDIAFTKLTCLPFRFQNCSVKELRYNFDSNIHFEAQILGTYTLVFCVEGKETIIDRFKESVQIFEKCDNGNNIGLYSYYTFNDYFEDETDEEMLEVLTEITEEEAERYAI